MKKILFLTFFIFISLLANAQTSEFGLASALNYSWVKIKETESGNTSVSDPITAGTLGWYFRFAVSKKWAVQPETIIASYGGMSSKAEIRLAYFALAVPFRVNITPSIFALTGPQTAILIGAEKDKLEPYKLIYSSWLLGAGYSFRELGLDVGLRCNFGLSDIHAATNLETQMNALQLTVFFRLWTWESSEKP